MNYEFFRPSYFPILQNANANYKSSFRNTYFNCYPDMYSGQQSPFQNYFPPIPVQMKSRQTPAPSLSHNAENIINPEYNSTSMETQNSNLSQRIPKEDFKPYQQPLSLQQNVVIK